MRPVIAISAAALLSACATAGAGGESYQAEFRRLTEQCQAQGGVLVPLVGGSTGDPASEYACTGASRARSD
jgi:hypothetical protein